MNLSPKLSVVVFGVGILSLLKISLISDHTFYDQSKLKTKANSSWIEKVINIPPYERQLQNLGGLVDKKSLAHDPQSSGLGAMNAPDTFPTAKTNLNVSLDSLCTHVLVPNEVLINLNDSTNNFQVHIQYPLGTHQNDPDNKLDRSHVGYCMIYSVTQISTGNKSWGKICVEDKLPPAIGCGINDTILCYEVAGLPSDGYLVNDNCSGPVKVFISGDRYTDYGCDSLYLQGVITRHLVARDPWGNSSQCDKKYYIRKISVDDVICARDTIIDCSMESVNGKSIKDPSRSGVPKVNINGQLISLWPNNPSCKLVVSYTDEVFLTCGETYKILRHWYFNDWCTGRDSTCLQWIIVKDTVAPVALPMPFTPSVLDTFLYIGYSDPHDCFGTVDLNPLRVIDCNSVSQDYTILYIDAYGKNNVVNGNLPGKITLPEGFFVGTIHLTDACNNHSSYPFNIWILDITPPTPVCKGYTQVTLDPDKCWAQVKAVDLDNGSRDNCCDQVHFAVAPMEVLTAKREEVYKAIQATCGPVSTPEEKKMRDFFVEELMNFYVFKEVADLDSCGSVQMVNRVYDICKSRLYDPHVTKYSKHEWYMAELYGINRKDFPATYDEALKILKSKTESNCDAYLYTGLAAYMEKISKGTNAPVLIDQKTDFQVDTIRTSIRSQIIVDNNTSLFLQSNMNIYVGKGILSNGNHSSTSISAPEDISKILFRILTSFYNDCMVNVLVDDKQPPIVEHLYDITVFCDGAPYGTGHAEYYCEQGDDNFPGPISYKGIQHGYYGGSYYVQNHTTPDEHGEVTGCPNGDNWSPIYCKDWLLLDSFDRGEKINPKDYFDKLVLFDRNHPVRALSGNEFSISDNCKLDTTTLQISDLGNLNGCGEGWLQRTWTIKDKCGNPVTAIQKIIVKHRSDFEVIFPKDVLVDCALDEGTDTSHTGIPEISDDECEQVGVRYEDEISTVSEGACYKIVRTWTLIDWCIFDPNDHSIDPDIIVDDRLRANDSDRVCIFRNLKDNGDGYIKYIQIIKVKDHEAPILTCRDTSICLTTGCSATVDIPLTGTDNCADKILYRIDITRPDGSSETRIDVKSIKGTFAAGSYTVKVTGKDHCGNESTCTLHMNINDCKKPTPYCLNGIATVVMPSTGSIQVWAKDLDRASEDNCTTNDKLRFSFSNNPSDASRILTCADILNGREQPIPLDIWVTDESGNSDFCKTYILLQDNGGQQGGVCKDTTQALTSITGRLYTEGKEGVEDAEVEVKGQGTLGIPSFKTSTDGKYSFSSIPVVSGQSIKALRDDNPMNGVSTLDLVLIQKHLLGTEKLNSPYRMIAADVNASDDISVVDLVELRKLILGLYDKLPNNTSWRFIPKSYNFSNAESPWGYPTEDQLEDIGSSNGSMVRDFIGVKIGDVNSSALAHSLMGTEIRSGETGLIFEVEDQEFKAGDKVSVSFRSPNFKGITGFQGTVRITNDELRFTNIGSLLDARSSLKMTANNFGTRWEKEGLITMSWNTNTSIDLKDDVVLFTLNFIAKSSGRLSEVLRIGSQKTLAESYEGKGELGNLSIRFVGKNGKEITGKSELYQNYPNPFDQRTVIGINLAQPVRGALKITDITGRVIKAIEKDWSKGYHEVWLDRSEIHASGVLYYSFESLPSGLNSQEWKTFRLVKKMVIVD